MTDNKGPEVQQGTAIVEKERPKTIRIREEFAFFDAPINSEDGEIREVADLATSTGELVGGLIGYLKTQNGERMTGSNPVFLSFDVRTNAEKAKTRLPGTDSAPIPGFPLENPIIYAYLLENETKRTLASVGQAQGENARQITFDQWMEVTEENKTKIIQKANTTPSPQPLPLKLHQLIEAKFKIT